MPYRRILISFLTTLLFVPCLFAASVEGDWKATLQAGPGKLRLALHIVETESGEMSATMDSLDQGAMGLRIDSISLEENKLEFTMNQLSGTYSGIVAADGQSIEGTWTQGPNSSPLKFERAGANEEKPAGMFDNPALERIAGVWSGTLDTGAQSLRLLLKIEPQNQQFRVTMVSVDQGNTPILVSGITLKEATVEFDVAAVGGHFSGSLDEKGTELSGTWTQGPNSLPLVLEKTG